jgi:hypothetical protein
MDELKRDEVLELLERGHVSAKGARWLRDGDAISFNLDDFTRLLNAVRATPPSLSTAPIPEDERAAFEVWAELTDHQKRGAFHDVIGWYYFDEVTQDRWDAWQARAAQVVRQSQLKPVAWLEAEPSARGRPAHEVIFSFVYSSRIHTKCAPMTSNPIWPLYAAPPLSSEQQADAEEIASVIEGALVDDLLPHHSCEWVERARSAIAQLRGTRKETPCGS